MRKRTNLCYLADLWRETWSGTFTFLREHVIAEIVFVVIIFIVTAIYKYHSGGDIMSTVLASLVISAVAALIVFICILIVSYGNADFNLWRADGKELDIKDSEIESLNKRINDLQKIQPNMSINDTSDVVMRNANLTEVYHPRTDGKELDIKIAEIASLNTRIYNQDAEIKSLNKRICDLQKIEPDMDIADAFDYVMSNVNLVEQYPQMDPDYQSSIAAIVIKDQLSSGTLYLWGRKADQSFGQDSDPSAYALERIEVDSWNEFSFTLYWEDYDEEIALYGEVKAARLVQGTCAPDRYLDLKFYSAQIMSIWPEDKKERS